MYPQDAGTLLLSNLIGFGHLTACAVSGVTAMSFGLRLLPRLLHAIRRRAHLHRRKKTARALAALRHDREYLLGSLPPSVSAQVLSELDRASLCALRATCRQAYLLVGASARRLQLDARALKQAESLPLEAVWPQLKVVSLQLRPLDQEPILWANPSSASASSAGAINTPSTGTVFDPAVTSHLADVMLREMLEGCGLDGLQKLQVLDMTGCSAGISSATWQCLSRVLPPAVTLLTPLRCLLGSTSTLYTPPQAPVQQDLLNSLQHIARQAGGARGLKLHLVGGACMVQSDSQLRQLATCAGPLLTRVSLSDVYPHQGSLHWHVLSHLSHLTHLAVAPATRLSLRTLLLALPSIPTITHLTLHTGSPSDRQLEVEAAAKKLPVSWAELALLVPLQRLNTLDIHILKLQSQPGDQLNRGVDQQAVVLPQLRNLTVLHLEADAAAGVKQLANITPNLTSLALGVCPSGQAAAAAGLSASEEDALLAATLEAATAAAKSAANDLTAARAQAAPPANQAGQPAVFPAVVGLGAGAGLPALAAGVAADQRPLSLPWCDLIQSLTWLRELHVAGGAAVHLASELASLQHQPGCSVTHAPGAPGAPAAATSTVASTRITLSFPELRSFHLHYVPAYPVLDNLAHALTYAPLVEDVGLHHVCCVGQQHSAVAWACNHFGTGASQRCGPDSVVDKLQGATALKSLTVTGGDFGLVHQLCCEPLPLHCLTLAGQHMLNDLDVHGLVEQMYAQGVLSADDKQEGVQQAGTHQDTPGQVDRDGEPGQGQPATPAETGSVQGPADESQGLSQHRQRRLHLLRCRQLNGVELEAALNNSALHVQCTDWSSIGKMLDSSSELAAV